MKTVVEVLWTIGVFGTLWVIVSVWLALPEEDEDGKEEADSSDR